MLFLHSVLWNKWSWKEKMEVCIRIENAEIDLTYLQR